MPSKSMNIISNPLETIHHLPVPVPQMRRGESLTIKCDLLGVECFTTVDAKSDTCGLCWALLDRVRVFDSDLWFTSFEE